MSVIDFHNHYYPPEYIEALKSTQTSITVTIDSEGNPLLHSPGDINIAVRGHRDIEYRQSVLDGEEIDMQVLTFTSPGVQVHAPSQATAFARMVNDALAAIVREKSDRFTALATLPLNDPAASVAELERATRELGLRGSMLFSNVNGVALSDERFWPLYAKAEELGAVLYIHPTHPVGVEAMTDFWLMPLVGFTFDTTLAAAGLVFSGVVERFPGINWVLAHLGGAIPYLAERLDRGYHAFAECRANITRPPSEQLREFYYDTVNFDVGALRFALDFTGADHLLAGSDYPHQIGSLRSMVESIGKLEITDQDRARILGGNASRLLRL
ncbi:MAG: amidohydrolase [Gemmatimonadota bacterium]|nr:MAG: amidohydrolase [Gemmatimonadota bacterium]